MRIKVIEYIAKFLKIQGVEFVFEMAGGMITQILDAIHQEGGIEIVSMHHEQSAAFAVDAYGRLKGNVAVGMATSGPGATNLITGIASCYFDSSPALFITGQVNTHEQKKNKNLRQLGFQETDIVSMTEGITKKSFAIQSAEEVETVFNEAYDLAISGRPGPVLIDIPMNIQRELITLSSIPKIFRKPTVHLPQKALFENLCKAVSDAKKPLILAGGGINCAGATQQFLELVEKLQIPVVTSLLALDALEFKHPLRIGFIGSYGNRWANLALGHSDLLIIMGSRLDIRQTGADVDSFAKNKLIFHIDCDPHEINNRVKNCIPIPMDLSLFIEQLLEHTQSNEFKPNKFWLQEIQQQKLRWPDTKELSNISGINPNEFMHALSQRSITAEGYIVDVGNHQMWAAQSLEIQEHQFFMTSGGMGAMGFALPAAIGACLANNKKTVLMIAGDGCFQLNLQELQTIVRNELPVKMIVINNNCLGMIRQFQDSYFNGRYLSTYWGYSAPNFERIANAYGIPAKSIVIEEEMQEAIDWIWGQKGAALLQVMIDMRANAYPKIAFGQPITEMEPFTKPIAMEAT